MSGHVIINGVSVAVPVGAIAYKYADPTEDARWIFDEEELRSIMRDDPSLIAISSSFYHYRPPDPFSRKA